MNTAVQSWAGPGWPLDFQATDKIHEAALTILERTGLRFDNAEALAIFKKAGVKIGDDNFVHVPGRLVEWALKCTPRDIAIYDRNEKLAMNLGGNRNYYGSGSDCANLYDLETGQRRTATMRDVHQAILILDAMPNLDFCMSMVMPSDVPLGKHEIYQMEAMLSGTTKPIVFVGESEASTVCVAEMLAAVRGGSEKLAAKPLAVNYINSVSPFIHNDESVRRLLFGARMNMPTVYQPGQGRAIQGPITAAGNVALGHAAQMGALVLHQLTREGAPFIRGLSGEGMLDLKSMVSLYFTPDMGCLGWAVAKRHGLPVFGTAGCSDSKIFDAQATAETAAALMYNSLFGGNLIHDVGYLDAAMTYSFELLVTCNEVIDWIRRFLTPAVIDDESLALDLIHEAGTKNIDFLSQRHTAKHLKETWTSTLFDRMSYSNWSKNGCQTLEQRARAKLHNIVQKHVPEPLAPEIKKRLQEIRERYVDL